MDAANTSTASSAAYATAISHWITASQQLSANITCAGIAPVRSSCWPSGAGVLPYRHLAYCTVLWHMPQSPLTSPDNVSFCHRFFLNSINICMPHCSNGVAASPAFMFMRMSLNEQASLRPLKSASQLMVKLACASFAVELEHFQAWHMLQ